MHSSSLDVSADAFYKVTYVGDETVKFVDDVSGNGFRFGDPNASLFRKVTAVSAPFAELIASKIYGVDSKVDAVEKRVSALEDDRPTQELTKGMRVKALVNGEFDDVKKGEYGVVTGLDCGSYDDPFDIRVNTADDHDYFRPQDLKVVAAIAKPEEALKVGDYVVAIDGDVPYVITDDDMTLGKVVSNELYGDIQVEVIAHEAMPEEIGEEFEVEAKYFRKATDAEIAKAKVTAKPKTGDIVVITANTNLSSNKVGDIGKVSEFGEISPAVIVPGRVGGPGRSHTKHSEMRLATDAEKAEYEAAVKHTEIDAVFTKAGRKPNEYRKGDLGLIVNTHDAGGYEIGNLVEVRSNYHSDKYPGAVIVRGGYIVSIEIVCFAEDRKDLAKGGR